MIDSLIQQIERIQALDLTPEQRRRLIDIAISQAEQPGETAGAGAEKTIVLRRTTRDLIRAALREHGSMTSAQLAHLLGTTADITSPALYVMRKRGELTAEPVVPGGRTLVFTLK